MPIFEYECAKCRKRFEIVSSGVSSERARCPHCASLRVRKLVSSFAVGKGKGASSGRVSSDKSSSACRSCSSSNCSTCR